MNQLIKITNQDGIFTVSSREVAENFEKEHKHVIAGIENLIGGVAEKSADLATGSGQNCTHLFIESKYQHEQNKQWYKEYQLTRDGFSLLVMGFTGTKALEWKLKYIEAFNQMENQIRTSFSELSPQLQLLIGIEQKQREHDKALADTNNRIDSISEIVALNPNNWRSDAKHLIAKIANILGGFDHIRDVNVEVFSLLDNRFKVSLETRLTNKRRRMAEEGICKSKRDKLTKVDIIADDPKLIEGYVAIVKEMAIKYGIADTNKIQ